jgi:hypothetical protein
MRFFTGSSFADVGLAVADKLHEGVEGPFLGPLVPTTEAERCAEDLAHAAGSARPRWNGHRPPFGDLSLIEGPQNRTASMCQSGVATQPLEERRP